VEAQAQMKYHHSERCFTYRIERPMVLHGLRAVRRQGLGFMGGRPLSREVLVRACSGQAVVGATRPREDPTVVRTAPIVRGLPCARVLFRDICQMGSLAGAAYLLHDNAGVLRQAQWEQKSHVAHKRKGLLD
jgi:hypothetical protein